MDRHGRDNLRIEELIVRSSGPREMLILLRAPVIQGIVAGHRRRSRILCGLLTC